ncbi:TRAP transporter substrate-binding protein [Neptunicoccus cionae]|uniref:TRAP transporter substrate-binding protein n=1 Tax=Neptunicoccus cionae TaxID=2035344 RepID=UPI000C77AA9C|nr:DctP family TRAP transporter solute-binding subunit [Amylibacter cionae]PLS21078.1 C4-dicarboxylate ABC transporter substrate-binding protein [Amylibacter cionae]
MTIHLTSLATVAALAISVLPIQAQTTIKLGHFGPGPDPFSQSIETFAERVSELSDGRLAVKVFPAGQLGNEKQQISALQGGLQEMLVTSTTNLSNMNPKFKLLDLPFVFTSYSDADAVTLGPVGEEIVAGLETNGLRGLALWENGFRAFTNSQRAVDSLEDFDGLKVRVIGAPVFIDTFTALGANPVPMPFPELYSAMETGTVDAQDNPALAVQSLKFYEVQDHYTATNHIYGAMIPLVSERFFKRLSDEDRAALSQAAREFGVEQRQILRRADADAVELLISEGGMEAVRALTPEAASELQAAVASVVEKNVTDDLRPLYEDMLTAIEDSRK